MLRVEDLDVRYGEVRALRGVSFEVAQGEVVTLLGGNGAGKSTTLRTISGLIKPVAGSVTFDGEQLLGRSPEDVARLGVVHVPEGRQVIPGLSVLDNLRLGTSNKRAGKSRPVGRARAGVRDVPAPEGPLAQPGLEPVRRRAADARHRPRAHGAATAADARRAVAGARADHRAGGVPDHPAGARERHHGAARGAERLPGAAGRRPRLRLRDRPGRAGGRAPATCSTTRRCRPPTSAAARPAAGPAGRPAAPAAGELAPSGEAGPTA